MNSIPVVSPSDWTDYELIDSGDGEKLERFGDYTVIRPDPRIIWHKMAPIADWSRVDAQYIRNSVTEGTWKFNRQPPNPWIIRYGKIAFTLKPTDFKHTGVFPEQAVNWNWILDSKRSGCLNILNLFAYTGGSTQAALLSGCRVTHVDSAKSAISWAHDNIRAAGINEGSVRWIIDDVPKFIKREIKRRHKYDGIIMDPPRFGRGSKGEVWKLEKDLPNLLTSLREILVPEPEYVIVNIYAADISALALKNLFSQTFSQLKGQTECFELALKETFSRRLVPSGICARWSKSPFLA